jgi:7-carboxy-7-deazaguanine synthase
MHRNQRKVRVSLGVVVVDVKIKPATLQGNFAIRPRSHSVANSMDSVPGSNHSAGQKVMRISEIYPSIHGESQYVGLPCTLVRTTGCDLRCAYCDTTYAFVGGREMSLDEIVAEVKRFGLPFVLLTGGEPMLQSEIAQLARRLLDDDFKVAIETSGAHLLDELPGEVCRILDVKTPSSGESHRMQWRAFEGLRMCDAVKFVLSDEADYRWSVEQLARLGLVGRTEVLLSPVHGRLDARELVSWVVRDRLPVRVNVQMHKYIWGPDTKGV